MIIVPKFGILVVNDDVTLDIKLGAFFRAEGHDAMFVEDKWVVLTLCREKSVGIAIITIELHDISWVALVEKLSKICTETEYIITPGAYFAKGECGALGYRNIVTQEIKPLRMRYLGWIIDHMVEGRHTEEALRKSDNNFHNSLDNLFLGADDYVRKPFNMRILAHIKAKLRRTKQSYTIHKKNENPMVLAQ